MKPGNGIGNYVHADVAHVQTTRRIREHRQHVEFSVCIVPVESACSTQFALPVFLDSKFQIYVQLFILRASKNTSNENINYKSTLRRREERNTHPDIVTQIPVGRRAFPRDREPPPHGSLDSSRHRAYRVDNVGRSSHMPVRVGIESQTLAINNSCRRD